MQTVPGKRRQVPVVATYSQRGGVGKTATAVNLALQLGSQGHRVGLVDLDFLSPGIGSFLGSWAPRSTLSLGDYLLGNCGIAETAYQPDLGAFPADLRVVPSWLRMDTAHQLLVRGYDIGLLTEAFGDLAEALELDLVLLDSHGGLNNETVAAMACSDLLLVIARANLYDLGTARQAAELINIFSRASRLLVLNMVPPVLPPQRLAFLQSAYQCDHHVALPLCADLPDTAGQLAVSIAHPAHRLTSAYRALADCVGQRVLR